MRILVTGSRDWWDWNTLNRALLEYATEHDITIVHGDCPTGADADADYWGKYQGVRIERHPADWKQYGRSAGFRRNAEMVNLGANICLAFIGPCTSEKCTNPEPHGSHGASRTADLAEKAGILVRRFTA